MDPTGRQLRLLSDALGAEPELHGRGGGSRTYRLRGTDQLVTVPLGWPDVSETAAEVVRRATLQERIADRVTIAVPRVVRLLPELGLSVVKELEGMRLIDAAPALRSAARHAVAAAVGRLLGELHTWPPSAYDDVAVVDDYPPEDWREETAEVAADLEPVLTSSQRRDVHRFLAAPAPLPAPAPVLSHNDLGIEHVLVSTAPGGPAVTAVIDWDDAAICDPAYDFGLLLRDLGPDALDSALAAYAAVGGAVREIPVRARFYARCTLLEDLRFGHVEGRQAYVDKSLAAWATTFRPGGED